MRVRKLENRKRILHLMRVVKLKNLLGQCKWWTILKAHLLLNQEWWTTYAFKLRQLDHNLLTSM
ncbi:hypothetical protein ACSBR1_003380 [Camellia fascicularis]